MSNEWIKTSIAQKVVSYIADSRPVWLYSSVSGKLLWRNIAACLLNAKQNENQIKLAPSPVSLKTQVEHILKLTPIGRSSLARIRFGSNKNQFFLTCKCTPLDGGKKEKYLLISGVDSIDEAVFKKFSTNEKVIRSLFGKNIGFILFDEKNQPIMGSENELKNLKNEKFNFENSENNIFQFLFKDKKQNLALFLQPKANKKKLVKTSKVKIEKPIKKKTVKARKKKQKKKELEIKAKPIAKEPIVKEPVTKESVTKENDVNLWQVRGVGFEQVKDEQSQKTKEQEIDKTYKPKILPKLKKTNKSSKSKNYNFEELSKILLDKTSQNLRNSVSLVKRKFEKSNDIIKASDNIIEASDNIIKKSADFSLSKIDKKDNVSLIDIPQETLILNRLPIGLIIFRDQNISFANKQIINMTGYENLADLRKAGLASLFPSSKPVGNDPAGPITHLIKKNGEKIRVGARLQIITWQGKSSFLLSATNEENKFSNVDNGKYILREFLADFAKIENAGVFITNRSAILTKADNEVAELLNMPANQLVGYSLSEIVKPDNISKLRFFLERDAKSAQTKAPYILLETNNPAIEMLLFAEGRAGIINSYIGMLRKIKISPKMHKKYFSGIDPKTLETISRSMRRPLNSIIGFSELISSKLIKEIGQERYEEYANDIKTASYELTNVVSDLENVIKLENAQPELVENNFDLGLLLEKSIFRTRRMAEEKQVLIRSSISGELGEIKADKASLEQAILNLIASAIEQTPRGEQVIITASQIEDGVIVVHVRNSGILDCDLSENFVVFRDGVDDEGNEVKPVESSVGLSLTRSLLAVNSCTLDLDPTSSSGTLFSLEIPAKLKAENNS